MVFINIEDAGMIEESGILRLIELRGGPLSPFPFSKLRQGHAS